MRRLFFRLLASSILVGGNVGLRAQALITADPIASGLANPIAITHAGDNRLFVTEQGGRIRVIDLATTPPSLLPTPFLDISTIVQSGGEEGLLSVAFDPDYTTNGFFYVYYTNRSGDLEIASYSVSADPNIANATGTPLLTIPHPIHTNHNGGQVQFGPDGFLYAATGDGGSGNDPPNNAQNRAVLLGKMLRIEVNGPAAYAIPSGNPYADDVDPNTRAEIWALGLRNPFRFTFDRQTGDIFIGDVGQSAREEIDLAPAGVGGLNFGWRIMEGTNCAGLGVPTDPPCDDPSLTKPILEYPNTSTSKSVISGYRYRGTRLITPGTYVYSDFYNGNIMQARPDTGGTWLSSLLLNTSFNLSAFGEDRHGEIYITSYAGGVYRLNPVDSDSDGLPNWWEMQYFASPTAAVAAEDSDGDGYSNLQEFTAATDPQAPASALRVATPEKEGATVVIEFPTVFGKRYQVEFKNDLLLATWTPLGDPVAGTGTSVEKTDTQAPDDERFYRVTVLP